MTVSDTRISSPEEPILSIVFTKFKNPSHYREETVEKNPNTTHQNTLPKLPDESSKNLRITMKNPISFTVLGAKIQ